MSESRLASVVAMKKKSVADVGRDLIKKSKLARYEKEALEELMDQLLAETLMSGEQVLRRIKAAIDIAQSHADEFAEIGKATRAAFAKS